MGINKCYIHKAVKNGNEIFCNFDSEDWENVEQVVCYLIYTTPDGENIRLKQGVKPECYDKKA